MGYPQQILELAKAGFYFDPMVASPDNVTCFLCEHSFDGWTPGDHAIQEHLKHSPFCGWAVTAAVEANLGDYGKMHPLEPILVDARKATFGGKWPYESKRGFKCKSKQLAEAGWKFAPTIEDEDMTICPYCLLGVSGWEPGDKAIDEHQRRQPECAFFRLQEELPAPKKPARRAKVPKPSNVAHRLSIQPVGIPTAETSDQISASDTAGCLEDIIMAPTTRAAKTKKTTARSRKAKAQKKGEEPKETLEDKPADEQLPAEEPPQGRKRGSESISDSVDSNPEAPPQKKRATWTGGTAVTDASTSAMETEDTDIPDAPSPKQTATRKRAPTKETQGLRRSSQVSLQQPNSTTAPQTDLSNDEAVYHHMEIHDVDVDPGRKVQNAESQEEADAEDPISSSDIPLPKKGRKLASQRMSKQAKRMQQSLPLSDPADELTEGSTAVPEATSVVPQPAHPELGSGEDPDMTLVSKSSGRPSTIKRGRGRPSKKSTSSHASSEMAEQQRASSGIPLPETQAEIETQAEPPTERRLSTPIENEAGVEVEAEEPVPEPTPMASPPKAAVTRAAPTPARMNKSLPPPPPESPDHLSQPPTTPRALTVARQPEEQRLVYRSPSMQSSNAENRTPAIDRHDLAPIITTPDGPLSPSKRKILSALQSTTPWTAVDLDNILSPTKAQYEKEDGIDRLLHKGSELTSPEKRMTVEEWIYHNASLAEQRLKRECEEMVSVFEKQGARAMQALEGLVVE
ncbi:hypothetical protein SMACR_04748 [Sordaria macrospora]|uniref:WGS project CABT00000000 data, contig 2.21 n=2 Tax=Sordaria macrospora TaxID=5147 RepID=F7W2B6_SORMK|nr:uncharacterized protein SMAC_04748 [Sordaria macrospora k-hell]KAA8636735.1 hypothetical protein SMACR_04748 [Sordaria macrospora]CCC11766.1 unnamed protein product [Sordaria macrospora k-hell]